LWASPLLAGGRETDYAGMVAFDAQGALRMIWVEHNVDHFEFVFADVSASDGTLSTHRVLPGDMIDIEFSFALDVEGNVVAVARKYLGGDKSECWMQKYAWSGQVLWPEPIRERASVSLSPSSVAVDARGNIAVAYLQRSSAEASDVWLQRYRPDGSAIWAKPVVLDDDGADDAAEVGIDPEGNVVLAGSDRTLDNHGSMRLIKYAR